MIEEGKSYKEIQLQTNLSVATIWRIKSNKIEVNSKICSILREKENDKLLYLRHRIYDSIDQETIEKASLLQRVTSGAILTEKEQLLAGKATQRVEFEDIGDKELEERLRKEEETLSKIEKGEIFEAEVVEE